MHAPKHVSKRKPERLIYLLLLLILTGALAASATVYENAKSKDALARRALAAQLMPEMQKCVRISRKMTYAGADIRGQLLPELKILLPTIRSLNLAVRDICGAEYMPVDELLLSKLSETVSFLESAYQKSAPAAEAEATLRQKLGILEDILASRFTSEGDLIKTQRFP